ncbi:hypothetical protein SAMN05661010_00041 [Modicisalibacter muralis]|uniref:Uncharacterized protein n=1 Tax=Modicisalibacter muralis TaxID=119000 RepID=A0A1G9EMY1_9GAMM|nr:hypothetical protein [Halomonas muralis]SDK77557.1 hypothetical protein SAMN05661010_00041 [Halomonas muralis]
MNERIYLVRDPAGRVHQHIDRSQGGAVQHFVAARAGQDVRRAVAWLVWLNYWRRGFRVVYAPAMPQEDTAHG